MEWMSRVGQPGQVGVVMAVFKLMFSGTVRNGNKFSRMSGGICSQLIRLQRSFFKSITILAACTGINTVQPVSTGTPGTPLPYCTPVPDRDPGIRRGQY